MITDIIIFAICASAFAISVYIACCYNRCYRVSPENLDTNKEISSV